MKTLSALNTPESKRQRINRLKKEALRRPVKIPSVADALEFRRYCYELTAGEFANILGLCPSHYSEIVSGKREITKRAMKRAFAVGVPAAVLLQP